MGHINYGLLDTIGGALSTIGDAFSNAGEWCVKIINAAYTAFVNLVFSALSILSEDIDSEMFEDFWAVVLPVNKVICVIASTLMVLLFVYNLATDAWRVRQDVDVFDIAKSIIKLGLAVVLVNNSLQIVKAIFTMGGILAGMFIPNARPPEGTKAIDGAAATLIEHGVSGVKGFIIFFVFLIAALLLIGCAVMVTFEIYERIFKIYILIPFASLSFSTFVLGDGNRGNEIFHGYMRSVITTALEALIIVLCISFTSSLVGSGKTLEKLLPALDEESVKELTCTGEDDFFVLYMSVIEGHYIYEDEIKDEISSELYEFLYGDNGYYASEQKYARMSVGGKMVDSIYSFGLTGKYTGLVKQYSVILYPEFGWLNIIMTLLKVVFPCGLCAGAVKKVSSYSAAIMGRG